MVSSLTSADMEIDGISVCRLCAEMSSSRSLTPLYTKDAQEHTVTKQINRLVENLISPNDGLPQAVCSKCANKVAQCYVFINSVIESQNKLRRTYHLPEIGTLNAANENDKENIDNGWEKEADYGSRASTSSLKRGTCDAKEKVDVWLENSVYRNLEANGANSTYRRSRPTMEERFKHDTLRLFRCGVCYVTFKDKNECLCHIVEKHPESKKPVSSDTIFESVYRQETNEEKRFFSKRQLEELEAKRDAAKSPASSIGEQPQKKARPRKILAIDGFYKEVQKRVTRYVCNMCGRVMVSEFTFRRHLREHEYSEGEEEMLEKEAAAAKQRAKSVEPRPYKGHCKQCKKSVPHSSRHRMYHTICVLEQKNPEITAILNKV